MGGDFVTCAKHRRGKPNVTPGKIAKAASRNKTNKNKKYNAWSESDMKDAVKEHESGNVTKIRILSRMQNIPYGSLHRRLKSGVTVAHAGSRKMFFFSIAEEDGMVEFLLEVSRRGFGYSRREVQEYALLVAKRFNKNENEFKASDEWLDGFLTRHNRLTFKKGKHMGAACQSSMYE